MGYICLPTPRGGPLLPEHGVDDADDRAVPTGATAAYETSGHLTLPLVTLHTTGDEVIPSWHELLYPFKVHTSGAGRLTPIPVVRYGHCNFTTIEVTAAFALLVAQSG